jgi:hypothetical protein
VWSSRYELVLLCSRLSMTGQAIYSDIIKVNGRTSQEVLSAG